VIALSVRPKDVRSAPWISSHCPITGRLGTNSAPSRTAGTCLRTDACYATRDRHSISWSAAAVPDRCTSPLAEMAVPDHVVAGGRALSSARLRAFFLVGQRQIHDHGRRPEALSATAVAGPSERNY